MTLAILEGLLHTSMGLNASSIGSPAIARVVQARLSACGLPDAEAYLARVRSSGAELQALIEAVVVPETWFFRDREAFAAAARLARDRWLPAHADGAMRLLSLPCSTGEEPYSLAMTLLDAGVPADRFRVDAVDISASSLAQGARGLYGRNSFRGRDLDFRDRHFDLTKDGYQVHAGVRQQVGFQQGNLFAADLLPGADIYDAIFCRNVLIYFDRPTQGRALAVLNRLLRADGVLFVAPAETGLPGGHGLVSTHEPLAFAFRKASAVPPAPKRLSAVPFNPPPLRRSAAAPVMPSVAIRPPPARAGLAPDIKDAIGLADRGHFVEAAACCEAYMRQHGPSAPAYYLMALVRDATGNHIEAAGFYRKALYLDPAHYDAQIQLALLMEKHGDAAGAQAMRDRARRLELRSQALR